MEPFILQDIFIGDYPKIEYFGSKPEVYQARYNLNGNPCLDFGCPSLTPILSANAGIIQETGFDTAGFGNYIIIRHNGFITKYGHLNDILIKVGETVISGALIGHSNHTGLCDTPRLSFGVAPCNETGVLTEFNNGFQGFIDPLGSRCRWEIKGLKAPNLPSQETSPLIPINASELQLLQQQAMQFKLIVEYLKSQGVVIEDGIGINQYIQSLKKLRLPIFSKKKVGISDKEARRPGFFLQIYRSIKGFIYTAV